MHKYTETVYGYSVHLYHAKAHVKVTLRAPFFTKKGEDLNK